MNHRLSAVLVSILSLAALTGCSPIEYNQSIRPVPRLAAVASAPPRLDLDLQASHIEVTSDAPVPAHAELASQRYDRAEIVSAVRGAWEGSFGAGGSPEAAEPARLLLLADIRHHANDVASGVLHGLSGYATVLFGVPVACADSRITLVVQTKAGASFVGRGKGSDCAGLYDTDDHKMKAFAGGIEDALGDVRAVSSEELARLVPTLPEIPERARAGRTEPIDRLIWPVQSTRDFPLVWGESGKSM